MTRQFRRVAVVNRGEPAMRLINAVREINGETDWDLSTIALFTEPDRRSMFVREADAAYELGPATFVDPRDDLRKSSYLDYARLEDALIATKADAVWVGWGFVAEHANFAALCEHLGINFIGPSSATMRRLGDKITSKLIAEEAQVPVAPWSGGAVAGLEEARHHAARIGYPLMVKATAGGGGRGIRRVGSEAELTAAFDSARAEAIKAFGDDTVFLERRMTGARHIEVQMIGDSHGTVWGAGVRDCSLQRRNQKVMEEAPAPVLSPEQDAEIREAAARLGRTAGYENAGTVEFLYDPASKEFTFMEVNSRLQVEHPVTEITTGLDLVKLQLEVARGHALEAEPPPTVGHAIEVRLNAEDPDNGFAPAPGEVDLFRVPTGPGLRIDTGVEEGDTVPAEFDSMIAKLIVYGRDRTEALARLQRALRQAAIVIRGGASNKGFLADLMARPEVVTNDYDVSWLDGLVESGAHLERRYGQQALLHAAIDVYGFEAELERAQFHSSAVRGRPEVAEGVGRSVRLSHQGRQYGLDVYRLGPGDYRIGLDGRKFEVEIEQLGRNQCRMTVGGHSHRVLSVRRGAGLLIEVDGVPHRVSLDAGGVIRAPAPAVVVTIPVEVGQEVAVGDRLAVLEAMKMELAVNAEFAGTVTEVSVRSNVQVAAGTPLLAVEPSGDDASACVVAPLDMSVFDTASEAAEPAQRCRDHLQDLRRLVLGYDVDTADLRRIVDEHGSDCAAGPDNEDLLELEDEILRSFVDVHALFRRDPDPEELEDEGRRSSEEYLFVYLRDPGAQGEGLPPAFVETLRRALSHYGVTELTPSPELDEALYRIAKSHQRHAAQAAPIAAVLQRRAGAEPRPSPELEELLERLADGTRGRFPLVHDLAGELHYRLFDLPRLEQARRRAYQDASRNLAALEEAPDGEEREKHVRALVECPQPLKSLLSARFETDPVPMQKALLEVMTRRYYRIRQLENIGSFERDGRVFVSADYDHEGRRIHVLTTHAPYQELSAVAVTLSDSVAAIPPEHDVVVDFYLWREDAGGGDADVTCDQLLAELRQVDWSRRLRRLVLAISAPGGGIGMGGVQHFTFRHKEDGSLIEDRLYRALHPMMGKRLEIWRLQNFDIRRLPSGEDLYLFHGRAHDNPQDERLFALAEVRDLSAVRDASGALVRLPEFERMFMEGLAGIRAFQATRPERGRLQWNRLLLYVWPPLDLQPDELSALTYRLAPATEGLGLEKVVVLAKLAAEPDREVAIEFSNPGAGGVDMRLREPSPQALQPLSDYAQKVLRLRRRGLIHPYELIKMITPTPGSGGDFPPGSFAEHDLDPTGRLVPVERPHGHNTCNVVVGVITNTTAKYREGMSRVIIVSDPSRGMGNLAEPECARIIAALDLAEAMGVPLEWFAVSAGALISMDSGTENMDWIARVLRRLVEFTQMGGEVNVIVPGINVGAQPYWNAEATMLMHTRGILIMTPDGAMVLTGKQALDYSGGVSAEDNQGIGGYERIMGPNGQAQYFARDLTAACRTLFAYYNHTYVVPGERFPRRASSTDPIDRDVRDLPAGAGFDSVGEIFSAAVNPGRKRPFEIRPVMAAVADQDQTPMERWLSMEDAEVAVVWDAHIGGYPVCLLGLESQPLARLGFVPADGPDSWTGGTLFPMSSKKVARAINAASGNRPVVVLANLSGFDGSPESLRKWQLEFGAEIGRAVVNFDGPIVFCVVSRYHGGAFVVFSRTLNDNMEVVALEGSYASVIGGAPAAAVVFAREVRRRAESDPRLADLDQQIEQAAPGERAGLLAVRNDLFEQIHSEKLGEVADEFDRIHSVYRAQEVGSVDKIIPADSLRPYLVEAIERGMAREMERLARPE